jgi:hypothetical protein
MVNGRGTVVSTVISSCRYSNSATVEVEPKAESLNERQTIGDQSTPLFL